MAMATFMRPLLSSFLILMIALPSANANPHHHANNHHAKNHHHDAKNNHHHANDQTPHAAAAAGGPWKDAHATFYGTPDGTIGGACGYNEKDKPVYGPDTTALSTALFNSGATCGACYEIKCDAKQWCKPGSVFVTVTDLCPPGGEGWCNSPKEHFDLSQPAFLKIAEYKAGIVPVKNRRVQCKRKGGLHFTITGNPYFNLVEVTNVGGVGDVTKVEVKVGGGWTPLKRNFGEKWETSAKLVGQKLLFRVTTSDGKTVISDAAPENWQFGQTFIGKNLG